MKKAYRELIVGLIVSIVLGAICAFTSIQCYDYIEDSGGFRSIIVKSGRMIKMVIEEIMEEEEI